MATLSKIIHLVLDDGDLHRGWQQYKFGLWDLQRLMQILSNRQVCTIYCSLLKEYGLLKQRLSLFVPALKREDVPDNGTLSLAVPAPPSPIVKAPTRSKRVPKAPKHFDPSPTVACTPKPSP